MQQRIKVFANLQHFIQKEFFLFVSIGITVHLQDV